MAFATVPNCRNRPVRCGGPSLDRCRPDRALPLFGGTRCGSQGAAAAEPRRHSRLTDRVADDDQSGQWVGRPPPERGVERQADQHGSGEARVDKRDATLGEQDRVTECFAGDRFPAGQGEHHDAGRRGPDDAERRVARMVATNERVRGLGGDVDGDARNAQPINLNPVRSRSSCVPVSSHTTTREAPISIAESNPKPAAAAEPDRIAAITRIGTPMTFQPRVAYSRRSPRPVSVSRTGR